MYKIIHENLCRLGHSDCLADKISKFDSWLQSPSSDDSLTPCVAVAENEKFDIIFEKFNQTGSNFLLNQVLVESLTCTKNLDRAKELLSRSSKNEQLLSAYFETIIIKLSSSQYAHYIGKI